MRRREKRFGSRWLCRVGLWSITRWSGEFFGEDILQDQAPIVPDGVVFGVLFEEERRAGQRFGGVFFCLDLRIPVSMRDMDMERSAQSYLCPYVLHQLLVCFDLLLLLLSRLLRRFDGRDAGHAMLHSVIVCPHLRLHLFYSRLPC